MPASPEHRSQLPRKVKRLPLLALRREFLFPHLVLPVWLSEPACSAVLREIQSGRRLAAVTTEPIHRYLDQGWAISNTVCACIAEIVTARHQDQQQIVCLLRGVTRARIEKAEKIADGLVLATLRVLPDFYPNRPAIDRVHRAFELCSLFRQLVSEQTGDPALVQMQEYQLPLGQLCDRLAAGLELRSHEAFELLGETNVDLRSDVLLNLLRQRLRTLKCPPSPASCRQNERLN